ncbi:MAG TPA: hypothetical protein VKG86_03530 [Terracidiphilus sp.]|nr:hypothetical protein [Terracidiphilus sp.]
MGQFDSPSEAALARIKSDNLSSSPVDGVVDKVVNLGGIILEAAGFTGASGGTRFFTTLKNLAVNKDEANLIYFGDALIDDIRHLYRLCEELKQRFDERINSPEFSAVVANATLHITRTNVESRLKRLARIVVNGVKEDDLEPESLDDMMRAAVELKDTDISMLGRLYHLGKPLLDRMERAKQGLLASLPNLHGEIQNMWHKFGCSLNPAEQLVYRGSFARLQSHGMIQQVTISNSEVGREPYLLLEDGAKFYERLQEIGKSTAAL